MALAWLRPLRVKDRLLPITLPFSPPPQQTTAKDYQRLWEDVTDTSDEGKAVRTLAGILLDKEGRKFISNLERKDAWLCIEILDHVSRDPYLLPSRHLRWFL